MPFWLKFVYFPAYVGHSQSKPRFKVPRFWQEYCLKFVYFVASRSLQLRCKLAISQSRKGMGLVDVWKDQRRDNTLLSEWAINIYQVKRYLDDNFFIPRCTKNFRKLEKTLEKLPRCHIRNIQYIVYFSCPSKTKTQLVPYSIRKWLIYITILPIRPDWLQGNFVNSVS